MSSAGRLEGFFTPSKRPLVLRHWGLIRYMVKAQLLSSSQSRVLGALWWILEPLILCMIYVFLLEIVLHRGRPHHGFFIGSAIFPWRWFVSATSASANSLVRKSGIIKSIRTELYIFPAAEILYATSMFLWCIPVYGLLMLWYRIPPTWYVLWFPVLMAIELLYIASFSLVLSVFTVYFRDMTELWSLVTRVWFYLSPCIYGIDNVPKSILPYYMLNPFAVILSSYRNILLRGIAPDVGQLLKVAVNGVLVLAVSIMIFRSLARRAPNYL